MREMRVEDYKAIYKMHLRAADQSKGKVWVVGRMKKGEKKTK